ncbi:ribosome biogenesis GTPase YlqF [Candidatus Methylomicrobium oryzae]|jgi:ribosome biogenesis GTPase A|uniref:ribosome biogenesis GTPase YlqF n=1 Tax=Candidatus Methylomicrobium oryzae TaxID=2802053 RepID=UPI0019216742|nr:ribosome biogenesis GTPase YlqF [Methylomicrobium sp. RS1]MBL1263262.1 ribosome biogenesis GTPase YlqF [Methylomicrobium sp. RS1]
MQIQWYPGHMHKAGKEIKEILPKTDIVIEVLDARIPFSSANPLLAELRGDKPCLKVLNKSDLADPELTAEWQTYLEQEHGVKTLALTSRDPEKMRRIPELCRKMLADQIQDDRIVHALIMGIPNVGKSTLINILAGRTVAKTGNEPAVTKTQQRIAIGNNVVLLDTPGMLWPNIENKHSGFRLAATGAIKDTALHHEAVAAFVAGYLSRQYPACLRERFRLELIPESDDAVLEAIGRKRGCLRAGGRVDLDKAAKILLAELRSGALGRITLETPDMMERELAEVAVIRGQKAEKKRLRKENRSSSKN